jgi:hypothetical protein
MTEVRIVHEREAFEDGRDDDPPILKSRLGSAGLVGAQAWLPQ